MNGGKNVEGSGHGKGKQAHSLPNKALQANTAGGLSARHRPQRSNQQMAGLAAHNNSRRCWPASRRAVQVDGGSAVVLAARKAGADLPKPVSTPPIAFACHCPYPLP